MTDPRAAEMRRLLVEEQLTLREIGERYAGLTRERVRQIIERYDPEAAAEAARVRQERRDRREAEESLRALLDAMRTATPCVVCRGWVIRQRGTQGHPKTCSQECADEYGVLRIYIDEESYEQQRLARARHVIAHRHERRPSEIALAERILAGTAPPPNRRYVVAGSRASELLAAHGRES